MVLLPAKAKVVRWLSSSFLAYGQRHVMYQRNKIIPMYGDRQSCNGFPFCFLSLGTEMACRPTFVHNVQ